MESKAEVYERLDALGVAYEITEHSAVFTIEEMDNLGISSQGDVCKNLFLRDDKGKRHFLVTFLKEKRADLARLRQQLGCSRLGFASAARLERYLGLHQGEVTPLGILRDREAHVEVVFDRDLEGNPRLGVHPNDNTATVWLSFDNLRRVVEENGNSIHMVEM